MVIEQLAKYEFTFHIERHSTTDSIWNIGHQEQRYEVFERNAEGVMYRQKCICVENNTEDHAADVYCPRNCSDGSETQDEFEDHEGSERDESNSPSEKAFQAIKDMVGLEKVKEHIDNIKAKMEVAKRQGIELREEHFGTIFFGNSGTGKTRISLLYWKLGSSRTPHCSHLFSRHFAFCCCA